jgi:hypothetical protein
MTMAFCSRLNWVDLLIRHRPVQPDAPRSVELARNVLAQPLEGLSR